MFVGVEIVDQVGFFIVPADLDVRGGKDLAQLVADQVDDGLEIQLGRQALLDAVDDL